MINKANKIYNKNRKDYQLYKDQNLKILIKSYMIIVQKIKLYNKKLIQKYQMILIQIKIATIIKISLPLTLINKINIKINQQEKEDR